MKLRTKYPHIVNLWFFSFIFIKRLKIKVLQIEISTVQVKYEVKFRESITLQDRNVFLKSKYVREIPWRFLYGRIFTGKTRLSLACVCGSLR